MVYTAVRGSGALGVALLLTLVTTSAAPQGPHDLVSRTVTASVIHVIDGDTIDVAIPPARRVRVRLHGVDTPETGEPFNRQAVVFARVLLFSQPISITGTDVDVYGRLVARVVVNQRDASEAVLEAGLACTFKRYVSEPKLDAALSRAQAARRGFWAPSAQQPGCVAREAAARAAAPTRTAPRAAFVGNTSSRVYHAGTCANSDCPNCTRLFATASEAEAAGFRPGGDCLRR